jgi:ATP-dependent Clp protease adaptor protein ClpS
VAKPKKAAARKTRPRARKAPGARPRRTRQLPPFNVVLLDDDDHTVDYVVEMLRKIFGYPPERSMQMVKEIDQSGRVIVFTTHKEHAELKRDQIHAYGADFRLENSGGSMSAVIEPAK